MNVGYPYKLQRNIKCAENKSVIEYDYMYILDVDTRYLLQYESQFPRHAILTYYVYLEITIDYMVVYNNSWRDVRLVTAAIIKLTAARRACGIGLCWYSCTDTYNLGQRGGSTYKKMGMVV